MAALALGAGTIEEVAEASGLSLKEVALAARRLGRAGLVTRDRHALTLRTELFGAAARAAAATTAVTVWESWELSVLMRCPSRQRAEWERSRRPGGGGGCWRSRRRSTP